MFNPRRGPPPRSKPTGENSKEKKEFTSVNAKLLASTNQPANRRRGPSANGQTRLIDSSVKSIPFKTKWEHLRFSQFSGFWSSLSPQGGEAGPLMRLNAKLLASTKPSRKPAKTAQNGPFRLIQEEEGGLLQQGPGDGNALLLATGELAPSSSHLRPREVASAGIFLNKLKHPK